MRIAKVWIEHPVLQLDQVFSYDALQLPAEKGKRVSVDFNGRQIVGFVDAVTEVEDGQPETQVNGRPLKPLLSVLDENALITPELFELAKWMAEDTLSPVISCFQAMLPSKLKPKSSNQKIKMEQIAVYVGEHPLLTPRQKEVLDWLRTEGPTVLAQWRKQSPAITRTLEKLVAHPETLYHESVLSPHGVYTFPLLFGLLFFSLTRRTPSLEDLSVVQQYFDKFLCELAQEA